MNRMCAQIDMRSMIDQFVLTLIDQLDLSCRCTGAERTTSLSTWLDMLGHVFPEPFVSKAS